jgi:hypothetical protein
MNKVRLWVGVGQDPHLATLVQAATTEKTTPAQNAESGLEIRDAIG